MNTGQVEGGCEHDHILPMVIVSSGIRRADAQT